MEVDGVSLTMAGAAVSAIAGVVGAWIKAKYGKPVVPPRVSVRPSCISIQRSLQQADNGKRYFAVQSVQLPAASHSMLVVPSDTCTLLSAVVVTVAFSASPPLLLKYS